jgi:hypothetical protein
LNDDLKAILKQGIEAAQTGNKIIARSYLRQVVEQDPDSELAWMWLTQCVDTNQERRECLEQVLRINPDNEKARNALEKLVGKQQDEARRQVSQGDSSLASLRQSVTQTDTPAQASPPSADQQAPLVRRDQRTAPRELWSSQRRDRFEGMGIYLVLGGFAVVLIALGVLLLVFQFSEEDEGGDNGDDTSEVAGPSTAELTETSIALENLRATNVAIQNQPPATPTIVLGTINPGAPLPTQIPPTETFTPQPTPTFTPSPPQLDNYSLVFSGNDTAGNPLTLYTIQADGFGLNPLDVSLPDAAIESIAAGAGISPEETVVEDTPPEETTEEDTGEGDEEVEDNAVEDEATDEEAADEEGGEEEEDTEEPSSLPAAANAASATVQMLDPAYSPDGAQIAFTGYVQVEGQIDRQEIFILEVASGEVQQLSQLSATTDQTFFQTGGAAWSPDGSSVMFHSNVSGNFELYLIAADGTGQSQNVTNTIDLDERNPSWSPLISSDIPDVRRFFVAYESGLDEFQEFEVFVRPLILDVDNVLQTIPEGENPSCRLTDSTRSSFSASWSPDGASIAFISNRGAGGDNDLYVMRSDGSAERGVDVIDEGWQERDPAWSPDSQWIAVSSNRNSAVNNLWVYNLLIEQWQQVTNSQAEERSASWLPEFPPAAPVEFEYNLNFCR